MRIWPKPNTSNLSSSVLTRILLDACVIFPTVMREVLLGLAQAELYEPLWSDRILEEWVRATRRLGDGAEVIARTEVAVMRDQFPKACVETGETDTLWLPDPDDIHVLAAGIAGQADVLVTKNISDFPTRVLGQYGILRRDPDGFLIGLLEDHPEVVGRVAEEVRLKAEAISGRAQPMRALLKRAGMPRLGKALDADVA